jgi:hypothetical protein
MKRFDVLMGTAGNAGGGAGAAAAPGRDGQLEVALSVARVSALVQVDASQTPFRTTPNGLFLRAFNDNQVGISDEQMAFFKARLKEFLPEIGATVDGIAEDASQIIGDVARIVRLAEAGL